MDDAVRLDIWSSLDHKNTELIGGLPDYYSDDTKRRLLAYRILSAYRENVSRHTLSVANPDHDADSLREFGDPQSICIRVAAAIYGEDPEVVVYGADDAVPDIPPIPEPPAAPKETGVPEVDAIEADRYVLALERWQARALGALERWQEAAAREPVLKARQDDLRRWAEEERLISKLREQEAEYVVPLGDGVAVLGWNDEKRRASVEILEPDAYEPVLDDVPGSAYPTKVHLIWQWEGKNAKGEPATFVRRVTYELVDIDPADGSEAYPTPRPRYLDKDKEHRRTCLWSDGTWLLDQIGGDIFNPEGDPIEWAPAPPGPTTEEGAVLNRWNTGLTFLPVVHQPNTDQSGQHFGRSTLAPAAQVFDELAANDTDEAEAARSAAKPIPIIDGLPSGTTEITLTRGKGIKGKAASVLDTGGKNLIPLMERGDRLQKRVSVVTAVVDGLRGRVDASEVPSGISLTLSYTPFVQLVLTLLRPARKHKNELLLEMVQKITIQNDPDAYGKSTEVMTAGIAPGSFMPQDLTSITQIVRDLLEVKAISREVALMMLARGGMDIGDAEGTLDAIAAHDFEGALQMAEALGPGSEALVAAYLGRDFDPDPAATFDPDASVGPSSAAFGPPPEQG